MKAILRTITCVLILAFVANEGAAQIDLSGKITAKGEPLVGATVLVKGSACGTFTDDDGTYTLKCSKNTTTPIVIQVRYVGYKGADVELEVGEGTAQNTLDLNFTAKRKFEVEQSAVK
jgi:hypothetical protein